MIRREPAHLSRHAKFTDVSVGPAGLALMISVTLLSGPGPGNPSLVIPFPALLIEPIVFSPAATVGCHSIQAHPRPPQSRAQAIQYP